MAAFDTTRTNYAAAGQTSRIGQVFWTVLGKFSAWNDARVTRNALSTLSDRELEDIGLSRGDIDLVSEGLVR